MNIDSSARAPFGRTETHLQPAEAKIHGYNGYNILRPLQVKAHQQPAQGQWSGFRAAAAIRRKREIKRGDEAATTVETACYLLSASLRPERCLKVVRSRWGVEAPLPSRFGVDMAEDSSAKPPRQRTENLTPLRQLALSSQ